MSGLKSQETVKFLSGPYSAEWAIDCFLYFPPSFFLNTAINFLSYSDLGFFFFLPFSLSPLHPHRPVPAVGAAEQDAPGAGGVPEAARAPWPGWAGEDPGGLSGERSENISCAGRWLQGSRKDHSDLDWKANDG